MSLPYPALFALHLTAVIAFVGGLGLNAATLPRMTDAPAEEVKRARQLNAFVITPALALVWLFGISMATEAGWFAAGWLRVKIGLVLVLSAIHGLLSVRLRRIGTDRARATGYAPFAAVLLLVAAVVTLAGAKPF